MPQTPQQRLDALLARLEPAVRKAFLEMIAKKAGTITPAELIDAVERALAGNDYPLIQLLQLNQTQQFPLTEAMRTAFIAGGQAISGDLPLTIAANFGFGLNARAAAQIEQITARLITGIVQEQADMTRGLIAQAVNEGIPARRLAYEIVGRKDAAGVRQGGYLGLDGPRAAQAAKVNAMLRDPERIKDYFIGSKPRFTTTDRRFDARVRRAIEAGKALDAETVAKITTMHRARLLKNRGDTISRNETLNALRAGEHAGWQQLVDSGAVAESRIERTWDSTRDGRTRPDHMLMHGQKVRGMSLPFTFPDGSMARYPGDASMGAQADQLIQCRCQVIIRINIRIKRPEQ